MNLLLPLLLRPLWGVTPHDLRSWLIPDDVKYIRFGYSELVSKNYQYISLDEVKDLQANFEPYRYPRAPAGSRSFERNRANSQIRRAVNLETLIIAHRVLLDARKRFLEASESLRSLGPFDDVLSPGKFEELLDGAMKKWSSENLGQELLKNRKEGRKPDVLSGDAAQIELEAVSLTVNAFKDLVIETRSTAPIPPMSPLGDSFPLLDQVEQVMNVIDYVKFRSKAKDFKAFDMERAKKGQTRCTPVSRSKSARLPKFLHTLVDTWKKLGYGPSVKNWIDEYEISTEETLNEWKNPVYIDMDMCHPAVSEEQTEVWDVAEPDASSVEVPRGADGSPSHFRAFLSSGEDPFSGVEGNSLRSAAHASLSDQGERPATPVRAFSYNDDSGSEPNERRSSDVGRPLPPEHTSLPVSGPEGHPSWIDLNEESV